MHLQNEMYWLSCLSFEKDHSFSAYQPIGKTLDGEEGLENPRLLTLESIRLVQANIGKWDYTDGVLTLQIDDLYKGGWPNDHASYRMMDLSEYGYPRGGIHESFEPELDYVWYTDVEGSFSDGDILVLRYD